MGIRLARAAQTPSKAGLPQQWFEFCPVLVNWVKRLFFLEGWNKSMQLRVLLWLGTWHLRQCKDLETGKSSPKWSLWCSNICFLCSFLPFLLSYFWFKLIRKQNKANLFPGIRSTFFSSWFNLITPSYNLLSLHHVHMHQVYLTVYYLGVVP